MRAFKRVLFGAAVFSALVTAGLVALKLHWQIDERLWEAVLHRDIGGARSAIRRGACTNQVDPERWPLLSVAASDGDLPMMQLLVEHGARLNPDTNGELALPLNAAIYGKQERAVEWLLTHGADPLLKRGDAYRAAAEECDVLALRSLLDKAFVRDPFLVRIAHGHDCKDAVTLLSGGFDASRLSPPALAAARGDLAALEMQSASGADLNNDLRMQGSPLFWAVKEKQQPVLEWLLDHGALPNMEAFEQAIQDCNIPALTKLLAVEKSKLTEESFSRNHRGDAARAEAHGCELGSRLLKEDR